MVTENADIKLKHLDLENFTTFGKLSLGFCRGINVIIGENSSGKTHLMKLLFSLLKGAHPGEVDVEDVSYQEGELLKTLLATFKPDALGRLATRGQGASSCNVRLTADYTAPGMCLCDFSFGTKSTKLTVNHLEKLGSNVSTLYIPPVEMLTIAEGFIAAYKNRETAYDFTYYTLAEALEASPVLGAKATMAKALVRPIWDALKIGVSRTNGRFYIKFKSKAGNIEANLAAEGLKKMALLLYLINNGSLAKNSILFWDEPEAHLNPKYIEIAVELLEVLARNGVQIFVSTHDYLLSQRLALLAETQKSGDLELQFISLHYNTDQGSSIAETAPSLASILHNPILDEFAKYASEEEKHLLKLF